MNISLVSIISKNTEKGYNDIFVPEIFTGLVHAYNLEKIQEWPQEIMHAYHCRIIQEIFPKGIIPEHPFFKYLSGSHIHYLLTTYKKFNTFGYEMLISDHEMNLLMNLPKVLDPEFLKNFVNYDIHHARELSKSNPGKSIQKIQSLTWIALYDYSRIPIDIWEKRYEDLFIHVFGPNVLQERMHDLFLGLIP